MYWEWECVFLFLSALHLKPLLSLTCNNQTIQLEQFCSEEQENNSTKCLKRESGGFENSENCPPISILDISYSDQLWSHENQTECTHFHIISHILNENRKEICPSQNASFLRVVIQQEEKANFTSNVSNCLLLVQQYNLTQTGCLSTNGSDGFYCIAFPNCTFKSEILKELQTNGNESKAEIHKLIEDVIPSESKQPEVPKVDREVVIFRRFQRKSFSWDWRDHVLEFTIASILFAILLLTALKLCLSQKFMDTYQNLSALEAKERRYSHRPSTSSIEDKCEIEEELRGKLNLNLRPGKPILKKEKPHHSAPSLIQIHMGNNSEHIKSFESNSSIYYDTMEYPDGHSQIKPLII